MKRAYILLALMGLALLAVSCGGGGGGSSGSPDEPSGQSPGVPSSVQLLPAVFVSQTNGTIALNAKVLDGNGNPVGNVPVTFVNLSTVGDLSTTTANTNTVGIASSSLSSTTSGFATVEALVNSGSIQVRSRRTVFFSAGPEPIVPVPPAPALALSVDSNGNNVFDEPEDFILFDGTDDRFANIRATVRDPLGSAVGGITVTFEADSSEATFLNGTTAQTDGNGMAMKTVEVIPGALRPTPTTLNIGASATAGNQEAFNLVTLFLEPVFVTSVTVSANPLTVQTGDTSTITAFAATNTGRGVPQGTTINFAADKGGIEPFAQTDANGAAQATFTAPPLPGTATVTASVGGRSGSTTVTVIASDLAITPSSVSVPRGGTVRFTIFGGVAPYTITSSSPDGVPSPATVTEIGGTFSVSIAPVAPAQEITLTVRDQAGNTVTGILTVVVSSLAITPSSVTILSGGTAIFTVSGGVAPYAITSSSPNAVPFPTTVPVSGGTFRVPIGPGAPAQTITFTALDQAGNRTTATLTVQEPEPPEPPPALGVVPTNVTVLPGGAFTFLISGGAPPFRITADKPTLVTIGASAPPVTTSATQFTVNNNLAPGCTDITVVITVVDSADQPTTATVNYAIDCP